MKKQIFVFICLLCFAVTSAYANGEYEQKIRKIEQYGKERREFALDYNLEREMENFLIDNENVSVRDFRKMRLAGFTSDVIRRQLNKKYGAIEKNYETKIADERERRLYKIALKVWRKWNYREFYACKNEDENAVKQSIEKTRETRRRIAELLQKNDDRYSDDMIKIHEQTLDECRFSPVALPLLDIYRSRGMREKYNNLILKLISDDQVNYDYLYDGIDSTDNSFVLAYVEFLADVNGKQKKIILSKEQVRMVAESLLTKEQAVFNMHSATFYSPEKDIYYNSIVYDGVRALISMSALLREYKLDDLDDKFINKFFKDDLVINTLRYDQSYEDFWKYLIQRPGFEKNRTAQ